MSEEWTIETTFVADVCISIYVWPEFSAFESYECACVCVRVRVCVCVSPRLLAYINMATFLTFHVLSVEMGLFANGYICVGGM